MLEIKASLDRRIDALNTFNLAIVFDQAKCDSSILILTLICV